jgi:hypothetical protein
MKHIISTGNPLYLMVMAFISFLTIATFYGGNGLSDSSKILLTVTSFVFGFYINSLITQSRSRHAKIVEALREEGGYVKAIYYMTNGVFPSETVAAERKIIDEYLMAGMDYKVVDYAESLPQFRKLFDHLMHINAVTKPQEVAWGHLVRIAGEISKSRNRIEALVKERVSVFEWMTTAILLLLVLYFVYTLNTGSIVSILITAFIATALTMLIIILHGLDSLKWKEDKWFWTPLEELFLGLDLIPYYPKILVDTKRLQLKKGQRVRLASYPNPYPNMDGKEVAIHK